MLTTDISDFEKRSAINNISGYVSLSERLLFYITDEELSRVKLPEGLIGINDFCKAINREIDSQTRRQISGATINKQLQKMGILGDYCWR